MPLPCPVSASRLEELCGKYGTPLQIYDGDAIRHNARELIQSFDKSFPGFKQFFAVKALPNPAILRLLIQEGCGLDCSSVSELYIAKELGVAGENVMFTSNFTSEEDLGIAFDQGVIINLDDASLVDTMIKARGRCPDLISFRLNPGLGRTDSETKSNVLGGPDCKFGVPPFQIVDAYRRAKENGSKRFGIHMMTGSCVLNTDYWTETVTVILDTVKTLRKELGIDFEFINIGGGLGIPYRPTEHRYNVGDLVKTLRSTFDKNLTGDAVAGMAPPKLYMENGRYMTGPFGWLAARCKATKDTYAKFYGLDACMSNLMRPGMYEAYHHITVPTADADAPEEKANVVGTLCENNDWFAKERMVPKSKIGDIFVIHDTGAHAHSMGFQYNGKLRAPEIILGEAGKEYFLVRDRECIQQLYSNTHVPDEFSAWLKKETTTEPDAKAEPAPKRQKM